MWWLILLACPASKPDCPCLDGVVPVSVVIASHAIAPGVALTPSDLQVVQMDPAYVIDSAMRELPLVIGRVTSASIVEGEPIRTERLAPPATEPGPAALTPEGEVAVVVAEIVHTPASVGDFVDVWRTAPAPCRLVVRASVVGLRDGNLVLAVPKALSDAVSAGPVVLALRHDPDTLQPPIAALDCGAAP